VSLRATPHRSSRAFTLRFLVGMRKFGGGGARVCLPAQAAYGSACVCCGLVLLFRKAAPFIVAMGDIDSDVVSVLTADSAATDVCKN